LKLLAGQFNVGRHVYSANSCRDADGSAVPSRESCSSGSTVCGWWRGLIHSKGARTSAAPAPRARRKSQCKDCGTGCCQHDSLGASHGAEQGASGSGCRAAKKRGAGSSWRRCPYFLAAPYCVPYCFNIGGSQTPSHKQPSQSCCCIIPRLHGYNILPTTATGVRDPKMQIRPGVACGSTR
jgi:hypothetical protein